MKPALPALIVFVSVGLLTTFTAPAFAQNAAICVVVDTERDTLDPQDQRGVRSILITEFEKAGMMVDTTGESCAEVYTVYNIKLGESINVTIHGPLGRRDAQARKFDELPQVYSQMVGALVSGEPMTNSGSNVNRQNVTIDQTATKRVAADSLKYVRINYGAITGGGAFSYGPGFGIGYRYELDEFAIDGSLNLLLANDSDSSGISGSWVKLMALRFIDPIASNSTFIGGGFSLGGTSVGLDGQSYGGSGLQGELTAGYEVLRSSTIRMFAEVNGTLPFYKSGDRWTPTITIGVGGGFGKTRTIRVIND